MGRVAGFAALVLLSIIFQTFIASLISIEHVMPDIYVILVVYLTLTRGLSYGLIYGFVVGLVESSADPGLFGLSSLLKVVLAIVVYTLSNRLRLESKLMRILVVFCSVALHNLAYYIVAYGFDFELAATVSVKFSLLDALYSALIAVVLLYLTERRLTLKFES
ncbi:MAG: rod shape-determining protein MreD [candidate division Zixibacteria bacterium]|jgi:rod shape-determining protein MreD|nr:rod shape-determining protein MreD [candidate division Zixibacteria bacterium]